MSKSIWSRKAMRPAVEACLHTEVITTETAGLSRSACADCGNVNVGFSFAMFQDRDTEDLNLATAFSSD